MANPNDLGKGTTSDKDKAEIGNIMRETKTKIEYSQKKDGSIGEFKIFDFISFTFYFIQWIAILIILINQNC